MVNWHSLSEEEILKSFSTSERGLNNEEAKQRLEKYGKNELIKLRKLNALKIFLSQFTSFLVIILIIAAVISLIIGHALDFYVIMGIVLLNSLLGFIQEYKAERAIEKLKLMLVPTVNVIRNNKIQEIDSREIVPGDILVLEEGDKIMADARILSLNNLETNEASLTGESFSVVKKLGKLKGDVSLGDRINMVFQGTQVAKGNCKAVVVNTGMKTEYGEIATLVQEIKQEKNPLKEKIDHFAKILAIVTFLLLTIIFIIGILEGFELFEIFLTAVSLAVSVIPEGLPAVITIGLALATQKMLKVNTLIRKLPAAETLGRTTVICTDKTGTITEEKMQVKKIFVNGKIYDKFYSNNETKMLFKVGILCNNARIENQDQTDEYIIGDPTEKALVFAAKEFGLDKQKETEKNSRVVEYPFSSSRKIMSIVRKNKDQISYVKGAPEIVLERCNSEIVYGKIKRLTDERKNQILGEYKTLASQGMRVLGFAYKTIIGTPDEEKVENHLVFVGFQAMIDPPRKEVKNAIKECNDAGIKVMMITGDALETAVEVGKQIGLTGKAITSKELNNLSDERLAYEIDNVSIFARVTPEDKLRIVEVLKRNKEIVAVTGDGVNDAPALKKADIGVAVNRGTDVAKDSSDIVLMDNNFASIPKAVKEGRTVYDNIKKFIKLLVSANFAEVFLVLAVLIIWRDPSFLPLLPLQILWMNLITDSLPALALSQEKAEKDIMRRKPDKNAILYGILGFIIIAGVLNILLDFFVFYNNLDNIPKARTMVTTMAVIFQMFLSFNCKSSESILSYQKNNSLAYAVLFTIILHIIAIYTPLGSLFSFVPLLFTDWLIIFGLGLVGFVIMEGVKKLRR